MKKFLLFFSYVLFSCTSDGDFSPDTLNQWTHFTNSSGLVNNLVTTLYTDSKGNVWIGTKQGLSKFNGSSFENFTQQGGELPDNWVLSILEYSDGTIFIGTKNGITIFDGVVWIIDPFFAGSEVVSMAETGNGDVWVALAIGVVQFFYSGGVEVHIDANCLPCNFVNTLFVDSNDVLWLGSNGDLKSFDGSFKSFALDNGLGSSVVTAVGEDHWGNLWFGLFDSIAITRFEGENFEQLPLVSFVNTSSVQAIVEDNNGVLWIAANDGGLLFFDGAVIRRYRDVFADEYITALTFDKDGALWVGTDGAGIARYFPGLKK